MSKLSAEAQAGLRLWAIAEHDDEMAFDAMNGSATEWAWKVFELRVAEDHPEWFPKGKWATIQFIEKILTSQAFAERRANWTAS